MFRLTFVVVIVVVVFVIVVGPVAFNVTSFARDVIVDVRLILETLVSLEVLCGDANAHALDRLERFVVRRHQWLQLNFVSPETFLHRLHKNIL